jgi:hypothetical protein
MKLGDLLRTGPVVVNIGVRDFAASLELRGVRVIHVDWRPPRKRDPNLDRILRQLL